MLLGFVSLVVWSTMSFFVYEMYDAIKDALPLMTNQLYLKSLFIKYIFTFASCKNGHVHNLFCLRASSVTPICLKHKQWLQCTRFRRLSCLECHPVTQTNEDIEILGLLIVKVGQCLTPLKEINSHETLHCKNTIELFCRKWSFSNSFLFSYFLFTECFNCSFTNQHVFFKWQHNPTVWLSNVNL